MSLNEMLIKANEKNASDLHLTVGIPPTARIDGELIKISRTILTKEDLEFFSKEVLSKEELDEYNKNGQIDISYSLENICRYRINIFKQRGNDAFAIRLLNYAIPSFEKLDLPEIIKALAYKKSGLVLVTGQTGSGKSTTLASIINEINKNRACHIITLEDPIEYMYEHDKSIVDQREIGKDALSYEKALSAALREDPDVILIGEMRDLKSISIAITAAETGHLVLSTLHTGGAAATIDRIIDVFPPSKQEQIRMQLSSTLKCVISQSLLKKKAESGRVVALEILLVTTAVQVMIRDGKTHQIESLIQTSSDEGMITLDSYIAKLYEEGKIEYETAIGAVRDEKLFNRIIGGH